jgi:hypothetical protein
MTSLTLLSLWAANEIMSIINVIQYQNPLSVLAFSQPVVHKLEDVSLRIPPPKKLDRIGDLPVALLEPRAITSMDPKNPRFRFSLVHSVCMFNREL